MFFARLDRRPACPPRQAVALTQHQPPPPYKTTYFPRLFLAAPRAHPAKGRLFSRHTNRPPQENTANSPRLRSRTLTKDCVPREQLRPGSRKPQSITTDCKIPQRPAPAAAIPLGVRHLYKRLTFSVKNCSPPFPETAQPTSRGKRATPVPASRQAEAMALRRLQRGPPDRVARMGKRENMMALPETSIVGMD